jgi:hypothetical protein
MCAGLDPGVAGETSGDTLACRASQAAQAAADPATYCRQAGPLGSGSCAKPCGPFCQRASSTCEPLGLFPYMGGVAECVTTCQGWPYLMGPNEGDLVFLSGDTLNCRVYHLEVATDPQSPSAAQAHCPHLGAVSATCN